MNDDLHEAVITALRIISEFGHLLDGEECATIAYKGELGDIAWLLAWEAPEWRPA